MPDALTITRDDVAYAYRLLLGRMPESEAVYADGLSTGSLEALRRRILDGPEFVRALKRDTPARLRRLVLQDALEGETSERADTMEAESTMPPRIVFLHIMKTAGTSLRNRLEAALPDALIWRHETQGRPGDVDISTLLPYRAFVGHFNFADAWHVPRPRRIFTVLREPRERILSLYHYLARHREDQAEARNMRSAIIARRSTLAQFLRHQDLEVRESLQNHMTCRLAGDYRPIGKNRYVASWQDASAAINGPTLLRMAINNLAKLDFVTTVERLELDRSRLMHVLGLPDLGPLPRDNTQHLISKVLELRAMPEPGPEEQKELFRLTELDRMLYRLVQLDKG